MSPPTRCDPEWGGEYCDEPLAPLPTQLKDSFSKAPSLSHWTLVTGGKLSSVCGAVASGAALHFSGVRWLVHDRSMEGGRALGLRVSPPPCTGTAV